MFPNAGTFKSPNAVATCCENPVSQQVVVHTGEVGESVVRQIKRTDGYI